MLQRLFWTLTVATSLMSAAASGAATITLNDRGNCNCTQLPPPSQAYNCYCYYSGRVVFSDPNNSLGEIQCWVDGHFAGNQTTGFNHTPGTGVWDYAKCATLQPKVTGSGPWATIDAAYSNGQRVAEGAKNWSP